MERVMKNIRYTVTFAFALACVLMASACNTPLDPPSHTPVEDGHGRIRVTVIGGNARTVYPSLVFDRFEYTFTRDGEPGVVKTPINGDFILEIGTYTVTVDAYKNTSPGETIAASGTSDTFTVVYDFDTEVKVGLTEVATLTNPGELTYTIYYPTDPAGASSVVVTLEEYPSWNNITLPTLVLAPIKSGMDGVTQTISLNKSTYYIEVWVTKPNGDIAGRSEAVHIKPLLTTEYEIEFEDDDFHTPDPVATIAGIPYTTLAAAITAVPTGVASPTEIILLQDVKTSNAGEAASGYTITNKNITLTAQGNRVITASAGASRLFTVDSGASLDLNGSSGSLTLNGGSAGVSNAGRQGVMVNGTLVMNGNVTITGFSPPTSNDGAGVYVNGGTFTMNGGAIEHNITEGTFGNNGGSGVYVSGGTFTMNDGTIAYNTAIITSPINPSANTTGGGGVYVKGGTFDMIGGTIEHNTANVTGGTSGGGGVYVFTGDFTMTGGTISGNEATSTGGGVYVSGGTFTMSGGIIYGTNETDTSLPNKANSGTTGDAIYVDGGTAKYDGTYATDYGTAPIATTNNTLPSI